MGYSTVLLSDDYLLTQMILSGPKQKVRKLHQSGASPVPQNASLCFELCILTKSSAHSAFVLTDTFTVQMSVCFPFPILTVVLLDNYIFSLT